MIHDGGHLRNFDSMAGFALNHCFKRFATGDFFNSLGYTGTFQLIIEAPGFEPKPDTLECQKR